MMPFVELAGAIELRQAIERVRGSLETAAFHERGDIETANKRPDSAVVIMMGHVEHAVVVPPIGMPRLDHRLEARHGSLCHAVTLDEVKNGSGLRLAGDAG